MNLRLFSNIFLILLIFFIFAAPKHIFLKLNAKPKNSSFFFQFLLLFFHSKAIALCNKERYLAAKQLQAALQVVE